MDEFEVRMLLRKTNYPFLAAYDEEWINADGKCLSFDEMGKQYLCNCYNYLIDHKRFIERGFFLEDVDYDKNQHEYIIKTTMELYYNKIKELEEYIS